MCLLRGRQASIRKHPANTQSISGKCFPELWLTRNGLKRPEPISLPVLLTALCPSTIHIPGEPQLQVCHHPALHTSGQIFLKGLQGTGLKGQQQFNIVGLQWNSPKPSKEGRDGTITPSLQISEHPNNWFAKITQLRRGEIPSFNKSLLIPKSMLFPNCINK